MLLVGGHRQRRLRLAVGRDEQHGAVRLALGIVDLGGDLDAVAHQHLGIARRDADDLDRSDRGHELPGREQREAAEPQLGIHISQTHGRSRPAAPGRPAIRPDRAASACSRGTAASATPCRGRGRRRRADLGRRLVDGRFAERPVGVLAVLGKLHEVDQVAAQFGKLGLDAAGGGLQAALAAQQPPPHAEHDRQRHQQPRQEQPQQQPVARTSAGSRPA